MFCGQLQYFRKLLNLTQRQVAESIGVTRQCYSGYELGTREPNIELIKKLCVFFNCTADELLEIETPEQRNKITIKKDGR